ncbi:MAG TPA: GAF domain-containing protein, partial [Desulfobacteraceae bacterium]|nr:GAF domain-containing protein [Desulfobacteraceae bacterium]
MTKKTTYGELEKGFNGLDCLYNISKLVDKPGILIEEILQGVVNLIPHAWQDPEITCARLIFRDKEFRTENFKETNWRHAEDIRGYDKDIGALEVYYLKERPERDEAPFLKEERNLLTIIAKQLGHIIERKHSEEELLHFNAALRAIRGVNQLLAKEKESNRLVQGICDKLIDTRAYFSAWIALLDKAGGLVTIAESGLGEHFLPMTEMIK